MRRFKRKPKRDQYSGIFDATLSKIALKKLKSITIREGSHSDPEHGMCIMESISYIQGQEHSDDPICVSNTITSMLMCANDSFHTNEERDKLKEAVPFIIGTAPTKIIQAKELPGYHEDKKLAYLNNFTLKESEWIEVTDSEHEGYRYAEKKRYQILSRISSSPDAEATVKLAKEMAKIRVPKKLNKKQKEELYARTARRGNFTLSW